MQVFSARLGSCKEAAREGTFVSKTEALLLWPLLHFKSLGWRFPKGDKATPDTWLPLYCLFSFIFSASLKITDIVGITPVLVFQSLPCVGIRGGGVADSVYVGKQCRRLQHR